MGYDVSISNMNTIKHGLLIAYIVTYTQWQGEEVVMIDDGAGLSEEYHNVHSDNWKNVTGEFIDDFNATLEEEQKQYTILENQNGD